MLPAMLHLEGGFQEGLCESDDSDFDDEPLPGSRAFCMPVTGAEEIHFADNTNYTTSRTVCASSSLPGGNKTSLTSNQSSNGTSISQGLKHDSAGEKNQNLEEDLVSHVRAQ